MLCAVSDDLSTTFDFGLGGLEDSTFEDITSTADRLLSSPGGARNTSFGRVAHEPASPRPDGGVDWTMVGGIAAVVGVLVAAVFGVVSLL
jgi:hypothetical protein